MSSRLLADPVWVRRRVVSCAVGFAVLGALLPTVIGVLVGRGVSLPLQVVPLLVTVGVLTVSSSLVVVSSVLWLGALHRGGRGADAALLSARMALWAWTLGVAAVLGCVMLVEREQGGGAVAGFLGLALIVVLSGRPPLFLQRVPVPAAPVEEAEQVPS